MVKQKRKINLVANIFFICSIFSSVYYFTACKKKHDLTGPDASFTYAPVQTTDVLEGTISSSVVSPTYNVIFTISDYNSSNLYFWDFEHVSSGFTNEKKATSRTETVTVPEGSQIISLKAINSYGTTENTLEIGFYCSDSIARFTGTVNNSSAFNSYKIDIYGSTSSSYYSNNILPWQTVSPASTSAAFDFTIKLKNYGMISRYNVKYKLLLTYKIGTSQYTKPQQLFTLAAQNNIVFN